MGKKGVRRSDVWIQNDKLRENLCAYLKLNGNVTSNHLASTFAMDLKFMQHQLQRLKVQGYVARHGGFHGATYSRTKKKFTRKYPDEFIDYRAIRNGTLSISIEDDEVDEVDEDSRTVIKVDEHTTIYMNSKKPSGSYKWQTKSGVRKQSRGSIQSGMSLFEGW
jgi:hypothetical protein